MNIRRLLGAAVCAVAAMLVTLPIAAHADSTPQRTLDKFQVTEWGAVFHTRLVDGVWQRYGYVQEQARTWVDVASVSSARDGDALHLMAVTRDGRLMHLLRQNQVWSGFGAVASESGGAAMPAPSPGTRFGAVASAIDEHGDLEVVATVAGGHHVVHTTRYRDGSWSPLRSLNNDVGWRGAVHKLAITTSQGHVSMFAVTEDGNVYQSSRPAGSRAWAPFYPIKWQCGEPGAVTDVSAVATGDSVHFMVIASGQLWHCGATPDSWSDFVRVALPDGVSPASVDIAKDLEGTRTTVIGQDGTVHDAVSDGHVFGAGWSPFGRVLNAAAPGAFVDASAQG
ncbi:hypothetical protein [Lentzea sp. E54]|uniref:hypothetical protein n=1 Tax=Lentzea xerophila TaxID=3435883 RepID=UPI003DA66F17